MTTGGDGVVGQLERLLGGVAAPHLAVLVDGKRRPAVDAVRRWRPAGRVSTYDARLPIEDLHVAMTAAGPVDALVDLVPRGMAGRLAGLLLHVRPGGASVLRLAAEGSASRARTLELVTGAAPQDDGERRIGRQQAVRAAVADLVVGDRVAGFRVALDALPVVRDADVAAVLASRPEWGRVLDQLPGESWTARCTLRSSGPVTANPTPEAYDAPPAFLREYRDVVCLPRQVALSRHLVLPESFTTVEDHRQRNTALQNLGTDFARRPDLDLDALPRLEGRWFHLDNAMTWHFGHAVSEQVSHLWGWRRAKAADPGLRALVFTRTGGLEPWQRDLLAAGGVPEADVHVATSPTRVELLVGCTPLFSRPAFVHPALLETYDEVGAALSRAATPQPDWPRRVFFTRRSTKRACRNPDQLLAQLTAAGFAVVHPEDHPLAHQVELVRRAEVIAGFAGSGMFHIAFAGQPKHVVLVCPESYPAHNEYMISALVGHRLDLVLCEPDVPREEGRWTRESFHSDYTYRPEREGVFLASVLASL